MSFDVWIQSIHGAGCAVKKERHAVTPGVKQGHGRVHEPDIAVNDRHHGAARHLGPSMCDPDGMLLMQAKEHLWRAVAQVIDEAVMQSAITCARVQRHERDVQGAHDIGRDIAAPAPGPRGGNWNFDSGRLIPTFDDFVH
jgi:hypothetical protein